MIVVGHVPLIYREFHTPDLVLQRSQFLCTVYVYLQPLRAVSSKASRLVILPLEYDGNRTDHIGYARSLRGIMTRNPPSTEPCRHTPNDWHSRCRAGGTKVSRLCRRICC
jgi:hypothetical protein